MCDSVSGEWLAKVCVRLVDDSAVLGDGMIALSGTWNVLISPTTHHTIDDGIPITAITYLSPARHNQAHVPHLEINQRL